MPHRALLPLLALLLPACFADTSPDTDDSAPDTDTDTDTDADTDTDTDTDADTDTFDGTVIETVEYDFTSDRWTYTVEIHGAASGVTLDTHQEAGGYEWVEYAELELAGTSGGYQTWEIVLPWVDNWAEYEDSRNTLFTDDMEPSMDRMITAFDPDQPSRPADCVTWSGRDGDPGYFASHGCDTITF